VHDSPLGGWRSLTRSYSHRLGWKGEKKDGIKGGWPVTLPLFLLPLYLFFEGGRGGGGTATCCWNCTIYVPMAQELLYGQTRPPFLLPEKFSFF